MEEILTPEHRRKIKKAVREMPMTEIVHILLSKLAEMCIDANATECKLWTNMLKIWKRIDVKINIKDIIR